MSEMHCIQSALSSVITNNRGFLLRICYSQYLFTQSCNIPPFSHTKPSGSSQHRKQES